MIKFCSYGEVSHCRGFVLCHNVEIGEEEILKKGEEINDDVINMLTRINTDKILIVSSKPEISKDDFKNFILENFEDVYYKEFDYLNKRYNNIFDENFEGMMIKFFKISILSIDAYYLITLLTNPLILKKSIDLSILSFYFSMRMSLSPREIEDVFFSALLCNISLCKGINFKNIADIDFLSTFKKSYNNSYDLIKDDKNLSNNVKRITLYFNDHMYNKNLHTNENNEEILRDPTLEIIQLTNDMLTYNFEEGTISLYSDKYTQIKPAISDFLKIMKNQKHKIVLKGIGRKLTSWLK